MRRNLFIVRLMAGFIFFAAATSSVNAQVLEWQLHNVVYSAIDPDAGGSATGTVQFTMRVRSTGADVPDVTGMSTGWSWQNANAMLPTGPVPAPTCGTNSVPPPSNVTISPAMGPGWTYNNVNQCSGTVSFVTGGQTFD